MNCLRCQSTLREASYEGVAVDECEKCGGVWLDSGELKQIIDIREKIFTPKEIEQVRGVSKQVWTISEPLQSELPCPKCKQTMKRFNYASSTGIALDKCADHGLWLDRGELEHVQICVEGWENVLSSDLETYSPVLEKVRKEHDERMHKALPGKHFKKSPIMKFFLALCD